jgi:hypothetical protein
MVLAVAATAESARPALFFLAEPATAKPGERVTVRIAGTPAGFLPRQRVRPFQRPIRLYIVPNAVAADVRSRVNPQVHFVGSITPDLRGRGVLTFSVPPLDAGDYAFAAWCPSCAAFSRGRTFFVLHVNNDISPRYRRQMLLRVRGLSPTQWCTTFAPVAGLPPTAVYGNGLLSTAQLGTIRGQLQPDGSLFQKLGWTPSGFTGTLTVRGERLDAPSPPMRVLGVHWGHSSSGGSGWASAVLFPSEGCWRISGRVGDVSLTYVVRVVAG